ncbi:protein SMAX1-LIKE 3-like isoform X2 [Telopea speciosissima]|uniref:protein SMAX1-LIKE 3-like isoform X2 n=1 Tax=Telopea speciosissima TaxID=54955 RepID=UPI001CC3918D|nr:protein SMAX1-LIKE 3-like isoform X2 [Telopea speciosissima]
MRTGGWTLQQALTADAANVVKQAVNLAKRRGHAQVTPLHVANTMLSSSTGLLRTACLQSHSHPLQCKALELCFNVALNRLPASTSSPMLGHHSHHPFLSNALVAAFKRAQAHQRRGSIENQQQPLLAVKVEIEQLIISILDDPSVSRVMREAGFSSTQVKSNVEQAVSLEICSQNPPISSSKPKESSNNNNNNLLVLGSVSSQPPPPPPPSSMAQFGVKVSKPFRAFDQIRNEDVMSVLETLMHRKRSTVIVGECLASIEGVVKGVMDKVEKGDVHEGLRDVQFFSLPLFPFGHFSKEDVEQKLAELRCLLKSCVGQGVVLYLGDLKWAAEIRANSIDQGRSYYCPMEYMIMELRRLVCGIESGRVWLMGIATFQTYTRCRIGNPSLEAIWHLHPLTVPAGSLSLSLNSDSDSQGQFRSKRTGDGSCCVDYSSKFNNEARSRASSTYNDSTTTSTTSSLPSWLKQYKEENKRLISNEQDCIQVRDLCHRWNSIGSSVQDHQHQKSEKTLTFTSISPSSSTSVSSHDHYYPNMNQTHHGWPIFAEPKQSWREHHIWISDNDVDEGLEPNFNREPKAVLVSIPNPNTNPNPSSTPNSASSSDAMEMEYHHRFKELNAENLKTLCNALEQKVPWQKEIIPEIASTILQCRSGLVRRKERLRYSAPKEDTWLFFHGVDVEGKEKIARELAGLVFGSQAHFISLGLSSFSSTRADSTDDFRNKRSRDESSCSYLERFAEAVCSNPHRVFLMEDIEQVDYRSQLGIKRAIERGKVTNSNGEKVFLHDAIVILSCESFSSRSRACSPSVKQKSGEMSEEEKNGEGEKEISPCVSLDLNLSVDEEDNFDDQSIDDIGLLDSVDRRIIFKLPDF